MALNTGQYRFEKDTWRGAVNSMKYNCPKKNGKYLRIRFGTDHGFLGFLYGLCTYTTVFGLELTLSEYTEWYT